jgi:plastocyanin
MMWKQIVIILMLVPFVFAENNFFTYYDDSVFTVGSVFERTFHVMKMPLFSTFYKDVMLQKNTAVEIVPKVTQKSKGKVFDISITKNGFYPSELKINVNQQVIWKNNNKFIKTKVIGVREVYPMKSDFLNPGDEFSWTFSSPGEFTYVDGVVIGRVGKIIVQ